MRMIYLLCLFVFLASASSACVEPDYDSGWVSMTANTNSYLELTHNLQTFELDVQVLVKATSTPNLDFFFPAMGFPQSDDDIDNYGGVVFGYNSATVRLWAPSQNDGTSLGYIIRTGGDNGWDTTNSQSSKQAQVRVLIWKEEFVDSDYDSDWFGVSGTPASSSFFREVSHGLGSTPSKVKALLRVEDGPNQGFIFPANTQPQKGAYSSQGFGGAVLSYSAQKIRLYTPQSDTLGRVVFIGDGWGKETNSQLSSNAMGRVLAWGPSRFPSDYAKTFSMSNTVSYVSQVMTITARHVVVSYVASTGFTFEAMGASQGTSTKAKSVFLHEYGGLTFGYKNSTNEVRVWGTKNDKSDKNAKGYIIALSDGWTNSPLLEENAQVTIQAWLCPRITLKCPSNTYLNTASNTCQNCDCGTGALNQSCDLTGKCYCKNGFADNKCTFCESGKYFLNGECLACNCGSGSSSNECVNGQCFCLDGYSGLKCSVCATGQYGESCANCACSSAGSLSIECDNQGICSCKVGFASAKCTSCSPGYFGTNCESCNCDIGSVDLTCNGSGQCTCKENFKGLKCDTCVDGYYLFQGKCVACNCGIGSVNQTCSNGACSCLPGFFGAQCDSCQLLHYGPTCQTCLDCGNGICEEGVTGTGKCICDYGFMRGSTGKCDVCSQGGYGPNCLTCPVCGNGVCNSGLYGDGSCICQTGWTGNSTNPCSTCDTGYILINSNCVACAPTCSQCSGPNSDQCVSCFSGFYLQSGFCISNCSEGKFLNNNGSCQDCNSTCKSCTSSTCLECHENYFGYKGSCYYQCPSGTFVDQNSCIDCYPDCIECTGSYNGNCTLCRESLFEQNGYCSSDCNVGYFRNFTSSTCDKCQGICNACDDFDTCTSCPVGFISFNGNCISSCPAGFFNDTGVCSQCFSSCKTCYGPGYFQCTSCHQNSPNPLLSQNICVSSCQAGQYAFQGVCNNCECGGYSLLCDSQGTCSNCQGNREGKNCQFCRAGYFMTQIGNCEKCSCNGHANSCINGTGICENCLDNTSGPNCELCAEGFEKSPEGNCKIINIQSNSGTVPIIAGAVAAVAAVTLVALGGAFIFFRKRKRSLVSPDELDAVGRASQFYEISPTKNSTDIPDAGNTIVNTVYGSEISLPGYLLIKFNEIKITEEIGSGGSGSVFSGEITNEDIKGIFPKEAGKVAIKLVRDIPNLPVEENIAIFHQEVSVTHAVSAHPNICKLVAYTETPNSIVTPLYQGDLTQLIYNKSLQYSVLDVLDMIFHIAAALEAVHSIGVSHRDIKPKNILLEPRQAIESKIPGKLSSFPFNLRICDFGVCHVKSSSLVVGSQKMKNQFGLSIRYASPESLWFVSLSDRFEDSNDYQRADIYSFGVTIWEICHRLIPWDQLLPQEIQKKVSEGGRPEMTMHQDNKASDLVVDIIKDSWNQAPDKRPSFADTCNVLVLFARDTPDLTNFHKFKI